MRKKIIRFWRLLRLPSSWPKWLRLCNVRFFFFLRAAVILTTPVTVFFFFWTMRFFVHLHLLTRFPAFQEEFQELATEQGITEQQIADITTSLSAYSEVILARISKTQAVLELVQKEELSDLKVLTLTFFLNLLRDSSSIYVLSSILLHRTSFTTLPFTPFQPSPFASFTLFFVL